MDEVSIFLSILIVGFSILLFIVSIAAFSRLKQTKLILISLAFLAFAVKGTLVLVEYIELARIVLIIDFLILLALYFATVKR